MKKRVLASFLCIALTASMLAGCTDSSKNTKVKEVKETNYDPKEAIADFEMGELNDVEKDRVIEMGYNNCDHMVAGLIGAGAGIFEALGLNVNLTKSGEILKAMSSGQMDLAYQGINGAINAVNEGAPFFMAAANHLGGSFYLVVSNDIEKPEDLVGKTIAIGSEADQTSPEWINWTKQLGIPTEVSNYEVVDMGSQDALFAMKAGKIDAFICCDPFASQAEFEGIGKIMATDWGSAHITSDTNAPDDAWALCCTLCMTDKFLKECPELSRRLVYAHQLSVEYMYQHPYNAAMIFAEGFGTDPYVALRTMYMKTVAEGRTITWHFTETNVENHVKYFVEMGISPENTPSVDNIQELMSIDLLKEAGAGDFETFIKDKIDSEFPIGMSFSEWYEKAKEIDQISKEDAVDIADTKTPYTD